MLPWTLRRRWTLAALTAIGIVSMLFAHWGSRNEPAAAFFLLPARAWELMIGAVRSEEHTSELQSLMRISYAVFCLKKKTKNTMLTTEECSYNQNRLKRHNTH